MNDRFTELADEADRDAAYFHERAEWLRIADDPRVIDDTPMPHEEREDPIP